ncbi:GNAT family N-acetyltransferase [Candidatus Roseilinea sp. NK_OTU-006]|jgi:ribosomal-protein-alanine N-acetyltransferase|uniref:GNAT family N-acetyltransferase n=1 Tax=Candidatus Roseilinea sp. NK_OTU-006 TaxID=2704250 RepID=UPI00145D2BAD|nr:GNAT family N-acetyltransferase [Candidatus Roseilinea sp. NK_OTU-006]
MNAIAASEPVAIAPASLLDLWAIRRVEQAAFGSDAYDLLTLLGLALTPRMVRLKATAGGRVVGFVAGEINAREGCGWIITIAVHPHAQGRGIGTALLLATEQALGASHIKLTVRRSNTRALALYERCGYAWVNTYRRYYPDGEDGLVMEKWLGGV